MSTHSLLAEPAPICSTGDVEELVFDEVNRCVDDIYKKWDSMVSEAEREKLRAVTLDLAKGEVPDSENSLNKTLTKLMRKHTVKTGLPKKNQLLYTLESLIAEGLLSADSCKELKVRLVTKAMKSQSGVVSITVLTSPYPIGDDGVQQRFTCKYNCYYCPDQPGQPRSYLRDEPAVIRANQNSFCPVLQFIDRASVLARNGHPVDKVEVLVLGGTWSNYPSHYQNTFVRDIFFAANTFRIRQSQLREKQTLQQEQIINSTAKCKIIGLTLETRPDSIDFNEVRRFRELGCTRVQIGIQHTDDGILLHINRGHDDLSSIEAIKLLKDNCFKIDGHLMPNLPGSTPEVDVNMFDRVLDTSHYQLDQIKIYPCDVTPFTVIKKWHEDGDYKPYSDEQLVEVISHAKSKVKPWTRLNRIVRDIPLKYIKSGPQENLREVVLSHMAAKGQQCRCIRCREAGGLGGAMRDGFQKSKELSQKLAESPELVVRQYDASEGTEYFISFESRDRNTLFGFCRLRINDNEVLQNPTVFDSLRGSGLVREMHVYGQLVPTQSAMTSSAQNAGFGRQLLAEAESISFSKGLRRMSVIAGVGSRGFYRKFGYELEPDDPGFFMHKNLTSSTLIPKGVIAKRIYDHVPDTGYFSKSSKFSSCAALLSLFAAILIFVTGVFFFNTTGYVMAR
eukprot:TRINITY_DN21011_c0_g1_i1.p1 TRINITY_DN21011_c0_g1~~TRINITY_DN21011_c0_g1_i1.p1  ORF type:complete len:676 (+),score=133.31 TRINITY_DN21011_c0_g1_i1:61-2088(+)